MNVYKVKTSGGLRDVGTLFIKAKDVTDCLFKARKKYESDGGSFGDELIGNIYLIEIVADGLIE